MELSENNVSEVDNQKKIRGRRKMINQVIRSLMEIQSTIKNKDQGVSEECFQNFKQTSAIMSSLLPKVSESDSSIFEVDDLLYPNEDVNAADEFMPYSNDLMNYFIEESYETFLEIYQAVDQRRCNRVVDQVYLQFIEHSPDDLFQIETVCDYIVYALNSKVRISRALKFLKFALIRKSNFLHEVECYSFLTYNLPWLKKVTNIPEPRHPDKKRLASWLRHQSEYIVDKLEQTDKYKDVREKVRLLKESCLENFDVLIFLANTGPCIVIDVLSDYFSSGKNEYEKQQQATYFVKKHLAGPRPAMCNYFLLCDRFFDGYECSNELMKIIDRCHCNDLKPYTWERSDYFVKENETREIVSCPKICGDETDYTIEKYLVYDEFLKGLYVMSTIKNALMTCEDLVRERGFHKLLESKIYNYEMTKFLNGRFQTKFGGSIPWWFPTLLKKCPFLILSEQYEYMIEPLMRMVKGEEDDDVTLERLYYVINC